MAFPHDLSTEQLLAWSPLTTQPPANEKERRERVERQFRLYFLADALRRLQKLGKKAASPRRAYKARHLRLDIQGLQALMLQPQNGFLVEKHARFVAILLRDVEALM